MRPFRKPMTSLAVVLAAAVALLGFTAYAAHAADADGVVTCQLSVPANPLTAVGLATPYKLGHGCHEANADQASFVEASVLDPATGSLSVYHPLVVDAGTQPVAAPVVPKLPANAVVGIWFGSNADVLKLRGPGAKGAVNGLGHGDVFGQFAYINAPTFFAAANKAIAAKLLTVPDLGMDVKANLPCPTVRDFSVVDQDQSDNVATAYWSMPNGQMSQEPVAGAVKEKNGSDEGLLAKFIDPAVGCTAWQVPTLDKSDPPMQYSLAANELQAAAAQGVPVALVPLNDPMTLLDNGHESVAKTNLYRAGVDQAPIDPKVETDAAYCTGLTKVYTARALVDGGQWHLSDSPDGPVATAPLDAFLAARYANSLTELGCPKPVMVHHGGHHSDHHRQHHFKH